MTIEEPDPFNLRMEVDVHIKDENDRTGLGRAKEIEMQINKIAGFDFCGFIPITTRTSSEKPECVTFLAHIKIKDFDLFIKQLKAELGIDVRYQWEFEN